MGIHTENFQWERGKESITREYLSNRKQLVEVTASKLSYPSGYLSDALTMTEIQAKSKLSELNLKIMFEAIERELKQAGLDYDLAYKNAVMEWEIRKANLYDVLQRELADAKKLREDDKDALANLAIEVGLRQVALINAKLVIEMEMEELKKQIMETKSLTLPKETELAQEKLATAQRRLGIIPHLQAIISAETDLITAEQANIPLTEQLINERLAQIPLKEDIADIKKLLVTARDALTQPKLDVAAKKKILADAKIAYETRAAEMITPASAMVTSLERMNAALQIYINKKGELVAPYIEKAIKLQDLIVPKTEYAQALAETVPYLRDLALKRRELIAPSIAKANALRDLIAPTLAKADKAMDLANAQLNSANIDVATKNVYVELERLKRIGFEADLDVMDARLQEGDYKKALDIANIELKKLKTEHESDLVGDDAINTAEYITAKEAAMAEIMAEEKAYMSLKTGTDYDVMMLRLKTQLESVQTIIRARVGFGQEEGSIKKIAKIQADQKEEMAEANASAKITSTLIHQLS